MKDRCGFGWVGRWLASVLSVFVFVAYVPACDAPEDDVEAGDMGATGAGGKADDAALSEADAQLIDALELQCGTQADANAWAAQTMYESGGATVVPLPGEKGYVIFRKDSDPIRGTPCNPGPPNGPHVDHYNIEVQICSVPGPRCSGTTIYNLHMAVWSEPDGSVCYASWENHLAGPRCIASACLDGSSFEEVWEVVKSAAGAAFDSIMESLQLVFEDGYNMHPVLAAVLAFSVAALIVVLIAIPPTGVPG
ncbi:MAG: hypothetical protein AAGA54_28440 [Myxococcota bacterium]